MADEGSIIGGVGSVVGGIGSAIQAGLGYEAAKKDLDIQNAQLRYSKRLQQQIFQREDTATYRKVQDLRRAGLSPVLAAGMGAGTGGVVPINTPKTPVPQIPAVDAALSAVTMGQNIDRTAAENKLLKAQAEKTNAEETLTNIKAAQAAYDYKIGQESGVPSNSSTFGKTFNDAVGTALKLRQDLIDWYNKRKNEPKPLESKGGATGSY